MKINTETLLIGGLVAVAGAFIFKDQICPRVKLPFICDSANGPDPAIKKLVDECAAESPGGVLNQKFMKGCMEDALTTGYTTDKNSDYAGYY